MRKKLPLISGILNVLEKLKGNTGIIENTDVAVHTIAAGKYVIWKNDLYKASSAISIGDTLSLSNLTAVSDGIGNELNSKITTLRITLDNPVTVNNNNGTTIFLTNDIPSGYMPVTAFVETATATETYCIFTTGRFNGNWFINAYNFTTYNCVINTINVVLLKV